MWQLLALFWEKTNKKIFYHKNQINKNCLNRKSFSKIIKMI